jgi:hypothetical protein
MTSVLLLGMALLIPGDRADTFDVQAELQGLYDEISQATLQFVTASDLDVFHDVLYTRDWVFIDTTGRTHTWPEVRQQAIQALSAPPPDSMSQPIRKVSVEPDGVTVIVSVTTVRTIVDHDGRYGRRDAAHTLAETTAFRDRWVRVSGGWKLKLREQIGRPSESVDKTE